MNPAALVIRFRIYRFTGIPEPSEAIGNKQQNLLRASGLDLREHLSVVVGALRGIEGIRQDFLLAVRGDAKQDMKGFLVYAIAFRYVASA